MMSSAGIHHVRRALEHSGGICPLDEVRALCPDLTGNQVFLAIDELSRWGEIRLTRDARGTYQVEPVHRAAPAHSCAHARLITDVLTEDGEKTGQVLCLECFARFKEPSPAQVG